ncbi:MAG: hypothetical protein KGK07_16560 [Chloroflexota bacterium]|nr:hypothetical protein [Chloroflexota bacterium]
MAIAPNVQTPIPQAAISGQQQGRIPFRRATYERGQPMDGDTVTPGAAQQILQHTVVGDGYMYAIIDRVVANASGNAAAVAYAEDAPWSFFQRVQLNDVSGDLINLSGFELYLSNLLQGQFAVFLPDSVAHSSLFTLTSGAVGTGGSYAFSVRYPVGLNHRDLVGIAANQSQTIKYTLTETVAPSTNIYTTAPTTVPQAAITRAYVNYAVPNTTSATGVPQDVIPPSWGIIHRLSSASLDVPNGGSVVRHNLRQVGQTIRGLVLIFRSNGSRATAETNNPTNIQLIAGSATIFNLDWFTLKEMAFRRYGVDMPNGVLPLDWIHDFREKAGDEVGDDYLHTRDLTSLYLNITYPAGFGSTNNSLTAITDELLNVA